MRIASRIIAYVSFCALVAAVQRLMGIPFWVAFGLDAVGGAVFALILVLCIKAIDESQIC